MVDQLSAFSSEVTSVALGVGTQGILRGQARVEGVQGTWADLTRNVSVLTDNANLMAMNLTNKVRPIAEVTKAVAGGALTKVIEVDVRGEILELKETDNGMTGSLSVFADEVTRVAKEVGTEGSRMLVEGFDG
ncbi:hypothetical protein BYT27DRAFT_7205111 [Phlegmacium glaucopus]|nr:hypothetical protein BYT27DRAFT_7205111 [Phlegmacium glaucopus]